MALQRDVSMETLISNVATKGGCTRVGVDVMEGVGVNGGVNNMFNTEDIFYEVIKSTAQKAHELGE
jgi:pyrroline-5-carboxylate reductase